MVQIHRQQLHQSIDAPSSDVEMNQRCDEKKESGRRGAAMNSSSRVTRSSTRKRTRRSTEADASDDEDEHDAMQDGDVAEDSPAAASGSSKRARRSFSVSSRSRSGTAAAAAKSRQVSGDDDDDDDEENKWMSESESEREADDDDEEYRPEGERGKNAAASSTPRLTPQQLKKQQERMIAAQVVRSREDQSPAAIAARELIGALEMSKPKKALTIHNLSIESISQIIVIKL
jgi:hypothetical protein